MQTRSAKRKLAQSESTAPVAKKAALPTKETSKEPTWIGQSHLSIGPLEMSANFRVTTYDAEWENPTTSRATFAWGMQRIRDNMPSKVRLFFRNKTMDDMTDRKNLVLTGYGSCWDYDGDLPTALAGTAELALRMFAPKGCSYAYVHFRYGIDKDWSDAYIEAFGKGGFELLEQCDEPINDETFERHMVFGAITQYSFPMGPTKSVGTIHTARLYENTPASNIEVSTDNVSVSIEACSAIDIYGIVMFTVENDDNGTPCINLDGMEIDPSIRGRHVASNFLGLSLGKTLAILSTLGIRPRKAYAPLCTRYPIQAQRTCLAGFRRHDFKLTKGGDYTGEIPCGGFPEHFFDPDGDAHDDTCLEFEKNEH